MSSKTYYADRHIFTARGASSNIYLQAGYQENLVLDGNISVTGSLTIGGNTFSSNSLVGVNVIAGECGTTNSLELMGNYITVGCASTQDINLLASSNISIQGYNVGICNNEDAFADMSVAIGHDNAFSATLFAKTVLIGSLENGSEIQIGATGGELTIFSDATDIQGKSLNVGTSDTNNFVTIGKTNSNTVSLQGNTINIGMTTPSNNIFIGNNNTAIVGVKADDVSVAKNAAVSIALVPTITFNNSTYYTVCATQIGSFSKYNNGASKTILGGFLSPLKTILGSSTTYTDYATTNYDVSGLHVNQNDEWLGVGQGASTFPTVYFQRTANTEFDGTDDSIVTRIDATDVVSESASVMKPISDYNFFMTVTENANLYVIKGMNGNIIQNCEKYGSYTGLTRAYCYNPWSKKIYIGYWGHTPLYYAVYPSPLLWNNSGKSTATNWSGAHYSQLFERMYFVTTGINPMVKYSDERGDLPVNNVTLTPSFSYSIVVCSFLELEDYGILLMSVGNRIYSSSDGTSFTLLSTLSIDFNDTQYEILDMSYDPTAKRIHFVAGYFYGYIDITENFEYISNISIGDQLSNVTVDGREIIVDSSILDIHTKNVLIGDNTTLQLKHGIIEGESVNMKFSSNLFESAPYVEIMGNNIILEGNSAIYLSAGGGLTDFVNIRPSNGFTTLTNTVQFISNYATYQGNTLTSLQGSNVYIGTESLSNVVKVGRAGSETVFYGDVILGLSGNGNHVTIGTSTTLVFMGGYRVGIYKKYGLSANTASATTYNPIPFNNLMVNNDPTDIISWNSGNGFHVTATGLYLITISVELSGTSVIQFIFRVFDGNTTELYRFGENEMVSTTNVFHRTALLNMQANYYVTPYMYCVTSRSIISGLYTSITMTRLASSGTN